MRTVARCLLVVGLAGSSTQAQNFSGPLSPGAFEATMNMGPIANTLRQQQQRQSIARPPSQIGNAASLRFIPSPARRRANFESFVARTRRVDPDGAASLEAKFKTRDLVSQLEAPMATAGLRADNLADAYTVWWITAWSAAQGTNPTPPRATAAAVKRQVESALLSSDTLRGAGDAAKQEFAEGLLIQAALLDGGVEQAKSRPESMGAVRAAATQAARAMGVDLAAMRLTPAGFVPAG